MKNIIFMAVAFFYGSILNATVITKIEISSQKSFENNAIKCNYSDKSVEILAETLVKQRGIFVGKGGDELVLYLDPNLQPLDNSQNCIGYLQTEFKYYEKIKIKDTNKFKYGINLICRRGKTFIFPKNTLQIKIEEIIKVHIDECLDEIKRAIS